MNIQLARRFEEKIDNGLTAKQVLLLELIKTGVTSTKELAHKLDISTSAVSQILNKLEDKGYIGRCINKDNRREIILSLADKANQYFIDINNLEEKINCQVYGQLSLEDLKELTNILEKLHKIVKENG
ncbi:MULTISPECIES: MarR family winged helix-turn-helix transcriptional regulator [Bacillus]|uniref:MarR family winged helix-turn-helix transcriptional regulator n=1 Tax=Bacillus TaxID=1386 RepID=UPI001F5BB365|nr:MarR family transcriptional regulator [Bacillus cereus]